MKILTLSVLGVVGIAALAACSSGGAAAGQGDAGDVGGGHDANPEGVPYPSPPSGGSYGHTARSGSTPGSIIANFKFLGYLNGDTTQPLTTISLADYYDPCNKRYTMIHLSVAALWCVSCGAETTDFVNGQAYLASQRIVVLQALDDGTVEGTAATVDDLNHWISVNKSNFTEMLDPGLENFGGFFNPASVPWNADLDPRTMEMIDSGAAYAGSLQGELQAGLSGIPATPSYPIPASAGCN